MNNEIMNVKLKKLRIKLSKVKCDLIKNNIDYMINSKYLSILDEIKKIKKVKIAAQISAMKNHEEKVIKNYKKL